MGIYDFFICLIFNKIIYFISPKYIFLIYKIHFL